MKILLLFNAALIAAFIVGDAGTEINVSESATRSQTENHTVFSADGTRIGYTKVGSGPIKVVIIHGALNSGEQWIPVATAMAEHYTSYVMDRWGRGGSESRAEYSLEREIEDIVAVLEAAGPDTYVMGHSSGAIYALEAALSASVAGLVLYEPPLHIGRFVEDVLPSIRTAVREERFDDVVSIFLREEGQLPDSDLSALRETPLWKPMVTLAAQSVKEWEELAGAGLRVERYRDVVVPVLLLAGTLTMDHPSFATQELETNLPDARIVMLEGQGHGANLEAPEMVAKEVINFIHETSQ